MDGQGGRRQCGVLRELTDPEDKAQLATAFAEVLTDFFISAARSLTRTATSSARQAESPSPSASDAPSTPSADAGPTVPDSSLAATATA